MAKKVRRSPFGHIEQLGDNYYHLFWRENGEPKSKRFRGTLKQAELFLSERELGIGRVSSYTWDQYWESAIVPTFDGLSERTIHDYKYLWEKVLSPRMGNFYVVNTNYDVVQRILNDIEAPSVQSYCLRLLRKICNIAVDRDGLLPRNPITRTTKTAKIEHRKKHDLRATSLWCFMNNVRDFKYEIIVLLTLGLGLTPEEAYALCYEDIGYADYKEKKYLTVTVSKALTIVGGKKILKETKNRFRERRVVLCEPFMSRVAELASGKTGPILPGRYYLRGKELSAESFLAPRRVTDAWSEWCKERGTDHILLSNMRTIFSTWCSEANVLDSLTSMAMGHSDGTTRGDNYLRITLPGMVLLSETLGDYLTSTLPHTTDF